VCNNRSYGNDETHQEHVAHDRGRPVENKVVGIRLEDPPVDFAALARSFGVHAVGPVTEAKQLAGAIAGAVRYVQEGGKPALVDVIVRA
jgi:thiamine pyrophosphate-dependent acetolactate synthase large subunit-like protein